MTELLSTTVERTLTHWVDARIAQPRSDLRWQLWCFEGITARRAAEAKLAAHGIHAQIHSAYKPLVHAFIEAIDIDSLQAVTLHYPVHPNAPDNRFLLEAYPLAAMLPQADLDMQPGTDNAHYTLQLSLRDGRTQQLSVLAPNRAFYTAHGDSGITPCGWQRATDAQGHHVVDEAVSTDYEQAYALAMRRIASHRWPDTEPYFGRLTIAITLPGFEQAIANTGEVMSTPEALHEELYFSLLEHFQKLSGRAAGDRRLQPGQIVPDIRMAAQAEPLALTQLSIQIHTQALPAAQAPITSSTAPVNLAAADAAAAQLTRAPSLAAAAALAQPIFDAHGSAWQGHSVQGRSIAATYKRGSEHAVVLSGGQHANEISGVTGGLRGALALAAQPDSHFAYIPIENPDGYALHQWYCDYAPHQMHHAARYTAMGDDLEYRDKAPWFESAVRRDAIAGSGAQLHISLHGYPAHEWTRPLTGYIPQNFDLWTIPKGFFLILRYHVGWQAEAEALAAHVTQALQQVPGLPQYNARQLDLYQRHSGRQPFVLINGTPCTINANNASPAPVTFITEFPDQTLTGDDLVFAHTVQRAAVLAAYAAWQQIMQNR